MRMRACGRARMRARMMRCVRITRYIVTLTPIYLSIYVELLLLWGVTVSVTECNKLSRNVTHDSNVAFFARVYGPCT